MGNVILNNIKLGAKRKPGLEISSLTLPLDNIIGVVGAKDSGKTQLVDLIAGRNKNVTPANIAFQDGTPNKNEVCYVDATTYLIAFASVKELMDKYEKDYPTFNREVAIKYFNEMQIPIEKVNYRNFDRRAQSAINCILAIASRASITIFDQPCRNMHLKLREMLYNFAKEDYEECKRTIIITSNIAVDIDNIANYIVYLRQNKVVFNMPYDEVDKFSIGLLGKGEVIKANIGRSEVYYTTIKDDGLVQMIVRDDLSLDAKQSLALNGVISQYVNLVNFHTYVVKEDFSFEEAMREREAEEKLREEKLAKKQAKKKVALVAKDDSAGSTATAQAEKKETFGEKLKRILTTDLF